MQGFSNREGSGIWCRIVNGKIVRSAEPHEPGAVQVPKVDKQGVPKKDEAGNVIYVWRHMHDRVGGRIIRLADKVDTFDGVEVVKLVITLAVEGGANINIDLKRGDRYWMAFANRVFSVDPRKDVMLEPYDYKHKVTGKQVTGLAIYQDEKPVPYMFTKEAPNGLPGLDYVKLPDGSYMMQNGRKIPIWQPIHDFLDKNAIMEFRMRLAELNRPVEQPAHSAQAHAPAAPIIADADEDPLAIGDAVMDDDDLPF